MADIALEMARNAGLEPGQHIEIDIVDASGQPIQEVYELVDNFSGESAFRATRIPHYELKIVPKFRRSPKPKPLDVSEVES